MPLAVSGLLFDIASLVKIYPWVIQLFNTGIAKADATNN